MRENEIERMARAWFNVNTSGVVVAVDVVRNVEPEAGRVATIAGVTGVADGRNETKNAAGNHRIYCSDTKRRACSRSSEQVNGSGVIGGIDVGEDSIARVRQQDRLQRTRGLPLAETLVVEEEESFVAVEAGAACSESRQRGWTTNLEAKLIAIQERASVAQERA